MGKKEVLRKIQMVKDSSSVGTPANNIPQKRLQTVAKIGEYKNVKCV